MEQMSHKKKKEQAWVGDVVKDLKMNVALKISNSDVGLNAR
jgi:hypothetical protein